MDEIFRVRVEDIQPKHKSEHTQYEYFRRSLVPKDITKQCAVSVYEIPPGKSSYPYHYHTKNEETYYIISGKGTVKTPEGNMEVSSGDFVFFPANERGAHKLTNSSETEMLMYIDFDTYNDIDVTFYPDSGKIGVWGKNINKLFKTEHEVEYYDGE